jgi:hypothetical protein
MQSWARDAIGLAAAAWAVTWPAQAEVVLKAENGFVARNAVEVTASPLEAWQALLDPAKWWLGQHTFSGDSANLKLDPVPGGCFCERLPASSTAAAKGLPPSQREGGVQHMRVIYAEPLRAMRLSGSLGPLQSEALTGTLTMTLKPLGTGTRILWEYVVGGFMRYKADEIGPAVDKVLISQLGSLAAKLGPVAAAADPAPTDGAAPATPPVPPPAEASPAAMTKRDAAPAKAGGAGKWSLPPAAPKPDKGAAAPVAASATKPALARTASASAVKPGSRPAPKAAVPPTGKTARKAVPKPPSAADIERREAINAFDAALGKPASPQ